MNRSVKVNSNTVKETVAGIVFFLAACFAVLSVAAIIGYLLYAGVPAFREIGVFNFLFGTLWNHGLEDSDKWDITQIYGILPMCVGCGEYVETQTVIRCPACRRRINPSQEEFNEQIEVTYQWD